MYFEGISACVSLTTKHVYCVTPCQLNRLLLFLVTIGIKIGKIKETNGFNRGNKLNTSTSTQNTRIDRIFFDSGEDLCRVTNKRKGVCRQW